MAPQPKPWFRFYSETVYDRKIRRLKPEIRWLFVACLCAARQSPRPGWLMVGETPMAVDDLVDISALDARVVRRGMTSLEEVLLISRVAECWKITSWDKRQFESDLSTPRVQASRTRRSNGDVTADVTAPETETETDPSSLPKRGDEDCPSCRGAGKLYSATAGRFGPCRCTFPPLKIAVNDEEFA